MAGYQHTTMPGCWVPGCWVSECQDAVYQSARMPACQGAGLLGARVPGCRMSGYQGAEMPQLCISRTTCSLRAWGFVVVPGRTLTPSPRLRRLCLPHLLRPRLGPEGAERSARAEDAAGGK